MEIQHLCTISIHYRVKINGSGFGGMRTKCANFTGTLAGYVSSCYQIDDVIQKDRHNASAV
jgi:hypothetical protein